MRGALQIARVGHALAHALRQTDARERIADLRQAVDPDVVIIFLQCGNRLLARPLGTQLRRLVHDVAQSEHDRRAAPAQELEGRTHLAAQAQGLLVHDEEIGIENVGGVLHDRGAHLQRFLGRDVQIERGVLAIAELDNAGHPHEIHPRPKIEAANDGRAR